MRTVLVYLLFGLGEGAVYVLLGHATVLTHRASGVVNFAGAAIGMYGGYVFFRMRATGDLVWPLIGLPHSVHLTNRPTVATALFWMVVVCALIGLVAYGLVFRALRAAPPLARVVASLGLMLYLISVANLHFGATSSALSPVAPVLPDHDVRLLGTAVPADRFWFAAVAVAVTALLWAAYRWTLFGLATRAAAETEKGAVLVGLSPDRLAAANWALASVIAGLALTLYANMGRLDPVESSLLIVPALAAALLGRFESFPITALGGLAIGMAHTEILSLRTDLTWLPRVDLQDAVPLLVILAVLVWRGRSLPTRGSLLEVRFPAAPRPRHLAAGVVVLGGGASVALLTLGSNARLAVITSTVAALLCLSIVALTGYVGQISLAPLAFAGVAAFGMVKATDSLGLGFPLAPLAGALLATLLGIAVGVPAVRVRGMSLAIATIAAALAIEKLLLGWSWFTGGRGGTVVPDPTIAGIDLGIGAEGSAFPRPVFGLLCVAVTVLAGLAVVNLRRSRTGLRWLAVRANEKAAAAAGIDVARAKLSAFAVSSFLAGLAGTLFAYKTQSLSVDTFQVLGSLSYLALTYLGGIASVLGAVVAGVLAQEGVLTALTSGSGQSQYQFAIAGIALMVVAVLTPDGLTGAARDWLVQARARWSPAGRAASRRESAEPGGPAADDRRDDEPVPALPEAGR